MIAGKLLISWSHPPGLNRRPADYESAALPAELGWLVTSFVIPQVSAYSLCSATFVRQGEAVPQSPAFPGRSG